MNIIKVLSLFVVLALLTLQIQAKPTPQQAHVRNTQMVTEYKFEPISSNSLIDKKFKKDASYQNAKKSREAFFNDFYIVQLHENSLASYSQIQNSAVNKDNHKKSLTQKIDLTSSENSHYITYLQKQQIAFQQSANALLKKTLNFTNQYQIVLNAVAVHLSEQDVATLSNHSQVKSIQKIAPHHIETNVSTELIQANQVWENTKEQIGHKGEGIIVGIIDTGVDYEHLSFADIGSDGYDHTNPLGKGNYLGACQDLPEYCNDKLIGMVAFPEIVDAQAWEYKRLEFNDPELLTRIQLGGDITGHGSHTASTAAGNVVRSANYYIDNNPNFGETDYLKSDFSFEVSGVAPRASIVSYQVCDFYGICYPHLAIESLEHAIQNGIDVINYSIGGSPYVNPWTDATSLAFLNARNAGLHVATSAGNNGPSYGNIGNPGNAPWVTSVAAYTHGKTHSSNELIFAKDTVNEQVFIGKGISGPTNSSPIIIAANEFEQGCDTDFAEEQFNGELVICQGDIFQSHMERLANAGATAVIAINESYPRFEQEWLTVPFIELSPEVGQELLELVAINPDMSASITGVEAYIDAEEADIAAYFSSRGPNLISGSIPSPHIAAPGVDIIAATPLKTPFNPFVPDLPPFMSNSGTSMASPHIAGAMALIHAIHPEWTPAQLQSALMTTAKSEVHTNVQVRNGYIEEVERRSNALEAGAGRVQIQNAIDATLLLNETAQGYLEAEPRRDSQAPTKINMSAMFNDQCYLSCSWTRTVTATTDGNWQVELVQLEDDELDIEVTPSSFSLEKGQSQEINVTVTHKEGQLHHWQFADIKLIHNDESNPISHLNVAVQFSAGSSPRIIKREVNRSKGLFNIDNIKTSGSDELAVTVDGLFKGEVRKGQTDSAQEPLGSFSAIISATQEELEQRGHLEFVEIAEDVTQVIIRLESWQKKHNKRVYVAYDGDRNQIPSFQDNQMCELSSSSNVPCIISFYPGSKIPFWIYTEYAKSNSGGGTSSNTAISQENDNIDEHSIMILSQRESGTDLSFRNTEKLTNLLPEQAYQLQMDFSGYIDEENELQPLRANEFYFANVKLGTSAEEPENVGNTFIELTRGQDDVSVSSDISHVASQGDIHYQINILPNTNEQVVNYQLELTLPDNVTLDESSLTDEASVDGQVVDWTIPLEQGEGKTLPFTLKVLSADDNSQVNINLAHSVDLPYTETEYASAESVLVDMPQALINGEQHFVQSNLFDEQIELSGSLSNTGANNTFDSSNPDLSYQWRQVSGPEVILDTQGSTTRFKLVKPEESDQVSVSFEFLANDGTNNSFTATAQIQLQETINIAPVAQASSLSVEEEATVTLDGSASFDENADELTFSWQGPGTIADNTSAVTTVEGLVVGSHEFTLTVSDGKDSDTIAITVTVTAKPVENVPDNEDNSGSSSGGAIVWLLLIILARLGFYMQKR